MGKYLTIWEADESKIPVDPKDGKVKDWGVFLGQVRGFSISEGTEEEVQAISMKYVPFFRFQIYPLISMDQSTAIVNAM
jgi:hypothetical protein